MKIQPVKCPTCGAAIQETEEKKWVVCEFCGNRFSLEPKLDGAVADLVVRREIRERMEEARDKMSNRLYASAMGELDQVLALAPDHHQAWLAKAACAEEWNDHREFHLVDAEGFYRRAIDVATSEQEKKWARHQMLVRLPDLAHQHVERIHHYFEQFILEHGVEEAALREYERRLRSVLGMLENLQTFSPDEPTLPSSFIALDRLAATEVRYRTPGGHPVNRVLPISAGLRAQLSRARQRAEATLAKMDPTAGLPDLSRVPAARRERVGGFTPFNRLLISLMLLALLGLLLYGIFVVD
ncbi:MAG: hypothetical protein GYA21_01620 [Myxococcales bacterium]|nr:hypothetical protein [Myxococcales bacterium]